jgi:hypothetical protein
VKKETENKEKSGIILSEIFENIIELNESGYDIDELFEVLSVTLDCYYTNTTCQYHSNKCENSCKLFDNYIESNNND